MFIRGQGLGFIKLIQVCEIKKYIYFEFLLIFLKVLIICLKNNEFLTQVEKKRSCGHTFKMNCHEDAEEITCRENCKRSLACGHFCKRKCHESCNPCTQLVDKVVPHCGHTAKVPCGRDALREDCENECELKVAGCQHPCRAKCAEACTVNCREVDGLQMGSCGHEVKRFCFEARQGNVLHKFCFHFFLILQLLLYFLQDFLLTSRGAMQRVMQF